MGSIKHGESNLKLDKPEDSDQSNDETTGVKRLTT